MCLGVDEGDTPCGRVREATAKTRDSGPDALWGLGRLGPLEEGGVPDSLERCPTVFFLSGAMQCHACEEFYTLTCTKPTKCEPGNVFCVTVVVSKSR